MEVVNGVLNGEAVQILVDTPVRKVTLLSIGQEFPFDDDSVTGKLHITICRSLHRMEQLIS